MRLCDIEGCGRPHVARGFCQGHYRRWSKTGSPGDTPLRGFRDSCSVEGCDRSHIARGYCTAHYQRWREHGDPGPADIRTGINSYSGAHLQVVREHGLAVTHPCSECGGEAAEWAYDHSDPDELRHPDHGSPYSLDTSRYRPMCRPCHRTFDVHPFTVSSHRPV